MYKSSEYKQITIFDFQQPAGVQLDPKNEWVVAGDLVPWRELEIMYAAKFPSKVGNVAKPLRVALGSLIIQARKGLSDAKTVQEIKENPYLQYFIGLEAFQSEAPFDSSSMTHFRKRFDADFMEQANEIIIKAISDSGTSKEGDKRTKSISTLILDATCAPVNICYPQDASLLNEARLKLERIIDWFHKEYGLPMPRTKRRVAHSEFLSITKRKRVSAKEIRAHLRRELGNIKRDLRFINEFINDGYALSDKDSELIELIQKLYDQQKEMWDNHTHRVPNRIVSLDMNFVRPIVRGKARQKTEFGPKFDVTVDEQGFGRIQHFSNDAYNENTVLINALEDYYQRTGHYPERILVDQIYRTRANRAFCKEHHIRMSGPKLGRKPSKQSKAEKKISRDDEHDRIEIERFFSLGKRCNGMGLIMTRRPETVRFSVDLSVLSTNLFGKQSPVFQKFYFCSQEFDSETSRFYVIFQDKIFPKENTLIVQ